MRVLIAISADYEAAAGRFWLWEDYAAAIWRAGGWPLILPAPEGGTLALENVLSRVGGLVISGGNFDIEPACYGQQPRAGLGKLNPRRRRFEAALINWALEHDLPTLGICGGLQAINVAAGGTLVQDLGGDLATFHQQGRGKLAHAVSFTPGALLARLLDCSRAMVNSTHHQVVAEPAPGFRVNAMAGELIEGIESREHRFFLGLQWHPEALFSENPLWLKPFRALVRAAGG